MKMILAVAVCSIISVANSAAQQSSGGQNGEKKDSQMMCPMHDAHSQMNERGEKGMGFSQTATTHHFFLTPDGGVIQVEVNDPADDADRKNMRMHLGHIARAFQNGDFDIPMCVHDTVPPGVPEMKNLRRNIRYSLEETPNGGRVVIVSADKDALEAIHQFSLFQIAEHKTGDPREIR